jgi:hypothetical protein
MAFLINESFTTGSIPASWWASSGGNYAYATSPAPLEGTYSLRMVASDGQALYFPGAEETGEQWGHFMFLIDSLPGSFLTFFRLQADDFSTNVLTLTVLSDGTITVSDTNGFHDVTTSSSISANTVYHVFWRYKPGSGSNSEKELWVNTTNNRAGTAAGFHVVDTAGAMTDGPLLHSFLQAGSAPSYIVDTVQWADTDEFTGGGGGGGKPWYAYAQQ